MGTPQRKVVHLKPPIVEETKRPFRIWDAEKRRNVPHRCYITDRRALDSALLLTRWDSKVGETLEVYDVRGARFIGAFTRKANYIDFKS